MNNGLGYQERPMSEQLCDLHIYVVPPSMWREHLHSAANQIINDTVSAGFIRVHPETNIHQLREEIDSQLGLDSVPRDYVFLRSVGRCLARVRAKQEIQLKAKHFLPPQVTSPEIFILERAPEIRDLLPSSTSSERSENTPYRDNSHRLIPPIVPPKHPSVAKLAHLSHLPSSHHSPERRFSPKPSLLPKRKPSKHPSRLKPLPSSSPLSKQDSSATHPESTNHPAKPDAVPSSVSTVPDSDYSPNLKHHSPKYARHSDGPGLPDSAVEELQRRKLEEILRKQQEDEERRHRQREEEEHYRRAAEDAERRRRDLEEEARRERDIAAARQQREAEEATRLLIKEQEEERKRSDELRRKKQEEDERRRKEDKEKMRREEEERKKRDDDERRRREDEERRKREDEERRKREDEERRKREDEERRKREDEERRQKENEKWRREEDERQKKEDDVRRRLDDDESRFPSPPALLVPTEDSSKEKERLLAELDMARLDRKDLEKKREELVRKAKQLQARTQHRRGQARDVWKKKYFEQKKKTAPLEERSNKLRQELESIHRRLMAQLEGSKEKERGKAGQSHQNTYKIQATRLQHDIEDLRRKVETVKMKLTAEMKLRNQAETELRALRAELTQKKINVSLTRSQQMNALGSSVDLYPTPRSPLVSQR